MNSSDPSHDQVVRDEWHVLGALEDLSARPDWDTRLLGEKVSIRRKAGNTFDVLGKDGATLQSQQRYGYLWASLGTPARPLFAIPEFDEPDRRSIVAAIIQLARGLDIHVVAEGVETQAQADILVGLGCGYGQGWLWSRAVPSAEVRAMLVAQGAKGAVA